MPKSILNSTIFIKHVIFNNLTEKDYINLTIDVLQLYLISYINPIKAQLLLKLVYHRRRGKRG